MYINSLQAEHNVCLKMIKISKNTKKTAQLPTDHFRVNCNPTVRFHGLLVDFPSVVRGLKRETSLILRAPQRQHGHHHQHPAGTGNPRIICLGCREIHIACSWWAELAALCCQHLGRLNFSSENLTVCFHTPSPTQSLQ